MLGLDVHIAGHLLQAEEGVCHESLHDGGRRTETDCEPKGGSRLFNPSHHGDRDSVVIESVLGQGEELVSGRVTPDTFTINKRTGMIRERRIAEKKRMKVTNKRGEGLAEVAIPRRLRQAQSLKSSELLELWSLARKLEAHYNHPQDFEWAVEDDGILYLLQTRPVTVLGGKPGADEVTSETEAELKGLGASPGIGV